jgi:hypothetical protein
MASVITAVLHIYFFLGSGKLSWFKAFGYPNKFFS